MALTREQQIKEYGWIALSCDPKVWGGTKPFNKEPVPQLCKDVPLPDTPLVHAAMEYVRKELPEYTFNHSMRVFYYGKENKYKLTFCVGCYEEKR
jgi:cyanamide hydratase